MYEAQLSGIKQALFIVFNATQTFKNKEAHFDE